MKNLENIFLTRHSLKSKEGEKSAEGYFSISSEGVELGKKRALEINKLIQRSPDGAIVFIGGSSEEDRNKATSKVYGEELKKICGRDSIMVITKDEIDKMGRDNQKAINEVIKIANENLDKKIVIEYPLFLKNFSIKNELMNSDRTPRPFLDELLKKHNYNEYLGIREWVEKSGKLENYQAATPEQVAERYLKGIERLGNFTRRFAGGRPTVIGIVGHAWEMDLLITYLANNGKVDVNGFDKTTKGSMIGETELVEISFEKQGGKIKYRGDEYSFDIG